MKAFNLLVLFIQNVVIVMNNDKWHLKFRDKVAWSEITLKVACLALGPTLELLAGPFNCTHLSQQAFAQGPHTAVLTIETVIQ